MTTTRPGAAATTDTFGYNQTGDTTSRVLAGQPAHTLAWDPEDRLASDTVNGQSTSFVYTPDGGRLLRRDPTHTTLYLPDGTELRWQRSGTTVAGTRYYSHAGRTVAVRQGSKVSWLAADHHGTAMFAVNAATLAVDRRRWLPFGQLRGTQPSWPGERGFVGGTLDPTTGLTHLGARDYDPATGRFISVDPVMDLADPQQMHGYTYSNNNPLTFSDASGLWCDGCNDGKGWPTPNGYYPSKMGNDGRPTVDLDHPQYKSNRMTTREWRLFEYGSDLYRLSLLDTNPGWKPKRCDLICHVVRATFAGAFCGLISAGVAAMACAAGVNAGVEAVGAAETGENPLTAAAEGAVTGAAGEAAGQAVLKLLRPLIGKVRGDTAVPGAASAPGGSRLVQGPYGSVGADVLEAAVAGGGPTTRVVTNLTESPIAGRALSVATGDSADKLAGAARGTGQMFEAHIPNSLLSELGRVGLAERRTVNMGGVSGEEIRFLPGGTEFIVKFFGGS